MSNTFKIVKIIDEYTLIINAGSNDGVNIDDKFQILDKKGNKVIDPDTKEVIGKLDLIKDTVTVTEVYEKMSVCSSKSVIKQNNILNAPLYLKDQFIEQQKLNIDLNEVTGGLRKSDEKIKIGDEVNLIKTSEE
ncbi:FlgT C-terminal domain-containing protein [Alkalibacillus almallahensis]|uniref:FlgT C-terminal domain-containing protein n=1 Tax=Alkalibacillus almallahensis TaxID=1379154 RepID=UPI0014227D10|nr:FlgT C-terminal domain-containing protein [Alkalibacillus almallahensis]NIK11155.1 hypothetical protein [Alkalibacillus almallahensis]